MSSFWILCSIFKLKLKSQCHWWFPDTILRFTFVILTSWQDEVWLKCSRAYFVLVSSGKKCKHFFLHFVTEVKTWFSGFKKSDPWQEPLTNHRALPGFYVLCSTKQRDACTYMFKQAKTWLNAWYKILWQKLLFHHWQNLPTLQSKLKNWSWTYKSR